MAKLESLLTLTVFMALVAGVFYLSSRSQRAFLPEAQTVQIPTPITLEYRYRHSQRSDDERPENDITFSLAGQNYLLPCQHDSSGLCAALKAQSVRQEFHDTAQKALYTASMTLSAACQLSVTYYYDNGTERRALVDKALCGTQRFVGDNASTLQSIAQKNGRWQKILPYLFIALAVVYGVLALRILLSKEG